MSPAAPERRPRSTGAGIPTASDPHITALATEPWPRGVSRRPTMNIGGVLEILKREFPTVTHSKIRFLKEQGLVLPERTPAGYRVFSDADVERLRYALAAQRDSFLPLRVIRERLAALDAGLAEDPGQPVVTAATGARLTGEELAELAGIEPEQVNEFASTGLITADSGGKFSSSSLPVVQLASELTRSGVDLRHLRMMRSAAERQVDVVAQLTAPLRGRPNAPQDARAREYARQTANDLSGLLSRLHGALVANGVDRLV